MQIHDTLRPGHREGKGKAYEMEAIRSCRYIGGSRNCQTLHCLASGPPAIHG